MAKSFLLFLIIAIPLPFSFGVGMEESDKLSVDFYSTSCPNLEGIIQRELLLSFVDPRAAPGFLRLMFYDCQVQGCDGSILLDSESSEIVSSRNVFITMREAISKLKSAVEAECPGHVSCADILVIAARESVSHTGGPQMQIFVGRKGTAMATTFKDADAKIPSSLITVDDFLSDFKSKGMTTQESIAILGGHTLGVGHCSNIAPRLNDPGNVVIKDSM